MEKKVTQRAEFGGSSPHPGAVALGIAPYGLPHFAASSPMPFLPWVGNPWTSTISGYITHPSEFPGLLPRCLTTDGAGPLPGSTTIETASPPSPGITPDSYFRPGFIPQASTPWPFPSMLARWGLAPCACSSRALPHEFPLLCQTHPRFRNQLICPFRASAMTG
jgi:hypothetical protein